MEVKAQSPTTIADLKNKNKDIEHVALRKEESDEESDDSATRMDKEISKVIEEANAYQKEMEDYFEKQLAQKLLK